jgi:hypothetical protein
VLKTQYNREHRELILFRQMSAVRYDILNWLISGVSGNETLCADSLPTVQKRSQQTVCKHGLSKVCAGVTSVFTDRTVRPVLSAWASHRAEKS